jgi:thiopurine S-methyltransferase
MQFEFWQSLWDANELGFHQHSVSPQLHDNIGALELEAGQRVFVPLAGKSLDILYLRDQGLQVVANEFVERAVLDFFSEQSIDFEESPLPQGGKRFEAEGITFLQSDFFALEPSAVGAIDAVFDRAALVAVAPEQRSTYAAKLRELAPADHRRLLVSFNYPQEEMEGPPFSVPEQEIRELFADAELRLLQKQDALGKSPFQDRLSRFEVETWSMRFRGDHASES